MDYILCHHGVKGQKWGVRRYQDKNGHLTPVGKARYSSKYKSNELAKINKDTRISTIDPHSISKVVTTVSAFTVVPAAAKLTNKKFADLYTRGLRKVQLEEMVENRSIKSFDDIPKLKKPMPANESVKIVNPGYPDEGSVVNCTFCTAAMALREMGFDVVAEQSLNRWYSDDLFKSTFGANTISGKMGTSPRRFLSKIRKEGDGAYGNLTFTWNNSGSHSVFWKNENGKVHLYDGQSGEEYTANDITFNSFLSNISGGKTLHYSRLDNTKPKEAALAIIKIRAK